MSLDPRSLASQAADLDDFEFGDFISSLDDETIANLEYDWEFWARPAQLEPAGNWTTWLAMAGRGFGKTRLGAEWVRSQICGDTPLSKGKCSRFALVAETAADVRDVMVQGPSGILKVHPLEFRPVYKKSQRVLEWPNGAIALLFSAEEPDALRGPEHDGAWSDELAKWRYYQETWDMLQFGLRAGKSPRQLVTTTPRPIPLIKQMLKEVGKGVVLTRGSTYDNAPNLATSFLYNMEKRYQDTRLGRQELNAEVLDDVPGALWTREMLELRTLQNPKGALMDYDEKIPEFVRVVVAVDPSGNNGDDEKADDIGIVGAAKGVDGLYYVTNDATCSLGPAGWARMAVNLYKDNKADILVAEKNYGGAMVENTIRMVDREVNFKAVDASRGKTVRAEPIAALYEQGRVRHVGTFGPLEDEMVNFTTYGFVGNKSPNRADALVWALTELALGDADYDREMWLKLAEA